MLMQEANAVEQNDLCISLNNIEHLQCTTSQPKRCTLRSLINDDKEITLKSLDNNMLTMNTFIR